MNNLNAAERYMRIVRLLEKTRNSDHWGWEDTMNALSDIADMLEDLEPVVPVSVVWINGELEYDTDIWYIPWIEEETDEERKEWGLRRWRDYMVEAVEVSRETLDKAESYEAYSVDHVFVMLPILKAKEHEE